MTIISVCNHKGGTGKTTSVIHMAAAFRAQDFRTLVIDLDPQGFLTRMLGVEEPPENKSSLLLFDHQAVLSEDDVHKIKDIDLLPASYLMTKIVRRLNKPTDVFWVKESLEKINNYDVVILDTAAAITVYSLNAMVASEYVLIPVTPEYQPVVGAEQTFQTAKQVQKSLNPALKDPILLITQVDARKKVHHSYRRYLRKKYAGYIMRSFIRTSSVLAETNTGGTTAFDHDPTSRGARDYANAADEFLHRIGKREGHWKNESNQMNDPTGVWTPIRKYGNGKANV